jgi:aldehyde:ferredoxin oxidoreductase
MVRQATGVGYTPESLLEAADRVYTLERLFLTKAGFSRADDTLAPRMFEPMPAGPIQGEIFDLDRVLDDYYVERGWDSSGIPTQDTLVSLGIDQYA